MEIKKYISLNLVLCSILFFLVGYLVGTNVTSANKEAKNQNLSIDVSGAKAENKEALGKVVENGYEVVFQVQANGHKAIIERTRTSEEEGITGNTGAEVEKKYKSYGYVLKSIDQNKVKLLREPLIYKPNRYILFVENNEIVIVKSDDKGSIFDKEGNLLGKEGTGTKFTSLRPNDIDNIIKGHEDMQFESIDQLNDGIKDFDIKYEMPE